MTARHRETCFFVAPAKSGAQGARTAAWIPAFAGMTNAHFFENTWPAAQGQETLRAAQAAS